MCCELVNGGVFSVSVFRLVFSKWVGGGGDSSPTENQRTEEALADHTCSSEGLLTQLSHQLPFRSADVEVCYLPLDLPAPQPIFTPASSFRLIGLF